MKLDKLFIILNCFVIIAGAEVPLEEIRESIQKIASRNEALISSRPLVESDGKALEVFKVELQERRELIDGLINQSIRSPEVGSVLKDASVYAKRLQGVQIRPYEARTKSMIKTYGAEGVEILLDADILNAISEEDRAALEKLTTERDKQREVFELNREPFIKAVKENQSLIEEILVNAEKLSELSLSNMLWQQNSAPAWGLFKEWRLDSFRELEKYKSLVVTDSFSIRGLTGVTLIFPVMIMGLYVLLRSIGKGFRETLGFQLTFITLRALVPSFILMALAYYLESKIIPASVALSVSELLRQSALFLGVLLVSLSLFSAKGELAERFNLPEEVLKWLKRVVIIASVSYYVLVALPSAIIIVAPSLYSISTILSLAFTAFFAIYICMKALSRKEAFATYACRGRQFLYKNWSLIRAALLLAFLAAFALGVMGYHFAWVSLIEALVQSIALVVIISIFYPSFRSLALQVSSKLNTNWDSALKEDYADGASDNEEQLKLRLNRTGTFVDNVFLIFSILALYFIWSASGVMTSALSQVDIFKWKSGDNIVSLTLLGIIMAAGVFVIVALLARSLPSFFELFIFPRFTVDAGVSYAVISLSRYLLLLGGVLVAFAFLKVDLSQLGWLVAALGVGLGFGLQEIVSNFVCGLILLLERPVRVGDTVTIDGVSGTITRINIRSTTVTDWNKLENVIPNKNFITQKFTNWSLSNKLSRIVIPIGVAYGTDPERVKNILLNLAESDERVLKDPAPMALFRNHGDSSLDFELRVYIDDFSEKVWVEDSLVTELNRAMVSAGIELPFPQRDLHIISQNSLT